MHATRRPVLHDAARSAGPCKPYRPARVKFLLIDGSITGFGGHHHQYALHCLEAAESMGYDTYLATNKKNRDAGGFTWKVIPAYRSGFWENDAYSGRMQELYRRFTKTRFKMPASLALRVLGPLVLGRILDQNRIEAFEQDTRELLSQVPLGEGDVAFIPTCGLTELLGAGRASGGGTWHFLFRRNIHDGSPLAYSLAYVKLRLLRAAFARFSRAGGVRARFWTDSEQLTHEYRMVSPGFGTLPIPHTYPRPERPPAGPFTVSYLGDARPEKGYHLLPRVVGDLWESHVRPGRARFVIQSNFNVPGGEPEAAVARAQLEQRASPGMLDLLTEPLDPDGYRRALESSSALLLPYDAQKYYARSSGICAEALAQGIPVIAPSGSWLARQFAARVHEHQDRLRAAGREESASAGGLRFRRGEDPVRWPARVEWGRPVHAWMPLERGLLVAKASFAPGSAAPSCRLELVQHARGGQVLRSSEYVLEPAGLPYATCAVELEEGAALLCASVHDDLVVPVELEDLSLCLAGGGGPRGAVGAIYDSDEDISACVAEVAGHAAHYSETARAFADRYRSVHNARSLVGLLGGRT